MKFSSLILFLAWCWIWQSTQAQSLSEQVAPVLKELIMREANWALTQQPETVTSQICTRSAGGINDFYSEGDYWWPDPNNPDGPYVRQDGETNPDNFTAHRLAMIRFSKIIGALASAYKLEPRPEYREHAIKHLEAWFINPQTRMTPHLLYAQAIKGLFSGRGIGIIDTIHLIEVAQGILIFQKDVNFPRETKRLVHAWFAAYLDWMTSHQYGLDEKQAKNNHGTCWVLQVACFAKLVNDSEKMNMASDHFKTVLLPSQIAFDGSFPLELSRTKPYAYSLFNLDAMVMIAQVLTNEEDNLWTFKNTSGVSLKAAIEYMYPFIDSKSTWPHRQDIMYWEQWPVAQPALLFGGVAYDKQEWVDLWKRLDHQPTVEEVIRNLPVRNPVIWLD